MKVNLDDLTLRDLNNIKAALTAGWIDAPVAERMGATVRSEGNKESLQPFIIGKCYLIRTVTHIDIGVVEAVGDKELVLSSASWIADTGRFHQCVKDGILDEVEPYVNDVILGRGAIIDATEWTHDIPKGQK